MKIRKFGNNSFNKSNWVDLENHLDSGFDIPLCHDIVMIYKNFFLLNDWSKYQNNMLFPKPSFFDIRKLNTKSQLFHNEFEVSAMLVDGIPRLDFTTDVGTEYLSYGMLISKGTSEDKIKEIILKELI